MKQQAILMKQQAMSKSGTNPIDFKPISVMKAHSSPIYVVRFNRDGQYIMTGSQDRSINLWNPFKEMLIKSYSGVHNYEVSDIAIANDNARFVSVGGDKVGFLWDISTGNVIRKFGAHHSRINCCAIGGENALIATGGYDCEIKIWDLKDKKSQAVQTQSQGHQMQKIKVCRDSVSCLNFNGSELIASSVDGSIRTFDIRMGWLTEDNLDVPITSFCLSNDHRLIATTCQDSKIRIIERDTGDVLTVLQGAHKSEHYSISTRFSFDDGLLLTGSDDGQTIWYDVVKSRPVSVHQSHSNTVSSVDVSPTKTSYISASYDGTAVLWASDSVNMLNK